ncbi:MAG TPA: NADH-quinone oxidoreductase subunit M, partial [Candidatus Methylomirabilis sp.]|nr:NADH-quinone oxidoreductase subunit M [Candidatus Methylomirabilis sp.]
MILAGLIGILLVGGLAAWTADRWGEVWPRWISLAALFIDLIVSLGLWSRAFPAPGMAEQGRWLSEVRLEWIPRWGIGFHLAIDGLSLLLILLTVFLGILSVGCSWTEIQARVGFFHFNLLWVLAGIIGVFMAVDLFLFYFFWEMMLVPMYFLI